MISTHLHLKFELALRYTPLSGYGYRAAPRFLYRSASLLPLHNFLQLHQMYFCARVFEVFFCVL